MHIYHIWSTLICVLLMSPFLYTYLIYHFHDQISETFILWHSWHTEKNQCCLCRCFHIYTFTWCSVSRSVFSTVCSRYSAQAILYLHTLSSSLHESCLPCLSAVGDWQKGPKGDKESQYPAFFIVLNCICSRPSTKLFNCSMCDVRL